MKILTPVLSGAVLVPILIDKVGEISGVDLSGLTAQFAGQSEAAGSGRVKEKKKKKSGGRKRGKGKARDKDGKKINRRDVDA